MPDMLEFQFSEMARKWWKYGIVDGHFNPAFVPSVVPKLVSYLMYYTQLKHIEGAKVYPGDPDFDLVMDQHESARRHFEPAAQELERMLTDLSHAGWDGWQIWWRAHSSVESSADTTSPSSIYPPATAARLFHKVFLPFWRSEASLESLLEVIIDGAQRTELMQPEHGHFPDETRRYECLAVLSAAEIALRHLARGGEHWTWDEDWRAYIELLDESYEANLGHGDGRSGRVIAYRRRLA